MIIRTTTGRSFKGVGAYVLHDKGAQTNERVSFTETLNLASSRENVALAEMVHTAVHQKELKRRAGMRATATSKPVYHLSLSWDVSEQPSLADQIEAARQSLKALGLDGRQAMIVGHTDTDNPHVHVVVNLVCPETGKTADIGNDRLKLSQWAQKYREDRGEAHLCPQRKKNNDRRQQGEFVKATNMTRAEYNAWKKEQNAKLWADYRAERDHAFQSRKGQYDALWQQKEERFAVRKDEIKQLYKPIWRDVFKRQRVELRQFDTSLSKRLKFALQQSSGRAMAVVRAFTADQGQRKAFMKTQENERMEISKRQGAKIRDAGREITKAYKYDRDQLKAAHKQENDTRKERYKGLSHQIWKQEQKPTSTQDFQQDSDRRQPENQTQRRTFETVFGNDQEALQKAREMQEKQAKRNRQKKRSRTRKRDDGGREFEP